MLRFHPPRFNDVALLRSLVEIFHNNNGYTPAELMWAFACSSMAVELSRPVT
ncbi:hypothetical protein SH467x_003689 [Pirellulaceae bacterium SH467]|jgi:hypothetical protein